MPCCMYCKRETTEAHALRVIYNHHSLHAEWSGWRMAGRWLVSPIGERIDASELLAMLKSRRAERLKAVSMGKGSRRGQYRQAITPEALSLSQMRLARGDAPPPQYAPRPSLP